MEKKYKSWSEKERNANHPWAASHKADTDRLYASRREEGRGQM